MHVNSIDPLAITGVGEADSHFGGVVLGLAEAFSDGLVPRLGFDHRELNIAILENIIGEERIASPARTFNTPWRNGMRTPDAAAFNNAPASSSERGINVLGPSFGFVHSTSSCFLPS